MTMSPNFEPALALKVTNTIACKLRAALYHSVGMEVAEVRNMLLQARALIGRAADFPDMAWGEGTGISQLSLMQMLATETRDVTVLAAKLAAGRGDEREFGRVLKGTAITLDMLLNTHTLRCQAAANAAAAEETEDAGR